MRLSLYDVGFVRDTWIGIANYRNLPVEGGYWDALRVSAKFLIVHAFAVLVISYGLGLALSRFSDRLCGSFLILYHTPTIFSGMITVTVWRWFFRYPDGALNSLLSSFHLPSISWLGNPTTAPWAVGIVMISMVVGSTVLLYIAAIGQIDQELIGAARVDGANELQIIWHIITPLTHKVRLYLLLLCFIGALNIWEHPFFYTGGGPLGSTTTVMLKVYHKSFVEGDIGTGSAMTVVTTFLILAASIVIVKYLREFLG